MMRTAWAGGRLAVLALTIATLAAAVAPAPGAEARQARYRARHLEIAADLGRRELPWTDEARLAFPARRPRDARGVPMERCEGNGRLVYPPGMLAINGMKRLDAFVETGDGRQLAQARAQARQLRRSALRRSDGWWIPQQCSYPPESQSAPWFNAMTQGLAISFFVRLHRVTGQQSHLDAARWFFRTFRKLDRRHKPWVSFVDADRYLWLEHYPLGRPDHVLNAHLHAVIGSYELWQVTRSRPVRSVLEGAITTMRDHGSRYRRPGRLSLYGLRHRTAHFKYHGIHVWQLRLLTRISGDRYFARLAASMADDVRPARYVPGRPQVRRPSGQGSLNASAR